MINAKQFTEKAQEKEKAVIEHITSEIEKATEKIIETEFNNLTAGKTSFTITFGTLVGIALDLKIETSTVIERMSELLNNNGFETSNIEPYTIYVKWQL